MKVEILEKEEETQKYPCLKVSKKGEIVLFSSPTGGTLMVTCHNSTAEVGFYHSVWDEMEFENFNGKLILIND
tara:strand:- start:1730 stop:1948 length:219 start_codon:yes stop_codon:yes gene_type:complete